MSTNDNIRKGEPGYSGSGKINRALTFFIAGLVSLVLAVGLIVGLAINKSNEALTISTAVQSAAIEVCTKSGNPLRKGLREEKEDDLRIAEHPEKKVIKALHLTEAQAIDLAQPRIKKLKYDINKRYAPVNCKVKYK